MSLKHIPVNFSDRRRRAIDRFTRRMVTSCGIAILLLMLLLFFWLIWVVLPLFAALGAAGENARVERLHNSANYGVLRMDVYAFHAERRADVAA